MIIISIRMKISIQVLGIITNNYVVMLIIYWTRSMLQALCLEFNIESIHIKFHLIITTIIWPEIFLFFYFTDEETETQGS